MRRIRDALDRLEIRYLTDGDGSLLAMWERHALLFALEGPDDEILVMRGRPHGTVPPDWADRAYRVVNEWNHTRRFCKAYVGDATERGMLPDLRRDPGAAAGRGRTTRCWTSCWTARPPSPARSSTGSTTRAACSRAPLHWRRAPPLLRGGRGVQPARDQCGEVLAGVLRSRTR